MIKRAPESNKVTTKNAATPTGGQRRVYAALTSEKPSAKLPDRSAAKKRLEKGQSLMGGGSDTSHYVFDNQVLMPGKNNKVMRFAITISIVFHVALMMVKFADPVAFNNFIRTSSLEVLLLNAATNDVPSEANFVARNNFAGGGDSVTERIYPTSPDEYFPVASPGDSFVDTIRRQNEAREQNMRQLTAIREQFSLLPPIDPSWGADDPRRIDEEDRRRLLSDRIAAIEQKISDESSRPRRMYIGPATRSDAQAVYYDSIRRKIELKGTESFPHRNGAPMYGNLRMVVIVNPEGMLVKAEVDESSGNLMLDRQAQAIVVSAGPFPSAPAEMLNIEKNIEFAFVMRFKFLNDGMVETELLERTR